MATHTVELTDDEIKFLLEGVACAYNEMWSPISLVPADFDGDDLVNRLCKLVGVNPDVVNA